MSYAVIFSTNIHFFCVLLPRIIIPSSMGSISFLNPFTIKYDSRYVKVAFFIIFCFFLKKIPGTYKPAPGKIIYSCFAFSNLPLQVIQNRQGHIFYGNNYYNGIYLWILSLLCTSFEIHITATTITYVFIRIR